MLFCYYRKDSLRRVSFAGHSGCCWIIALCSLFGVASGWASVEYSHTSLILDPGKDVSSIHDELPYGPVRVVWEVSGENESYTVEVFSSGTFRNDRLYNSEKITGASSDISPIISSQSDGFEVVWTCRNRPIYKCNEITSFKFRIVSCGCPYNVLPVLDQACDVESVNTFKHAVCKGPNCRPGQTANAVGTCDSCPEGTEKSISGEYACTACSSGSFASGTGNTQCRPCYDGTYQGSSGQAECKDCPQGTFAATGATSCVDCPNKLIVSTTTDASADYTGLGSIDGCGNLTTAGYWAIGNTGSVSPGGNAVSLSMSVGRLKSTGVQSTREFALSFSEASGKSTYFEKDESVGWDSGFTGTDVVPFQVSKSVETSETQGAERSLEVSVEASQGISAAVSASIETTKEVTCTQVCGYDVNRPSLYNGVIFNWVEALVDANTGEVLHFVRTCNTWCKFDNIPPQCPPGFCAAGDLDCLTCRAGAFANAAVDELASKPKATTTQTKDGFFAWLFNFLFGWLFS